MNISTFKALVAFIAFSILCLFGLRGCLSVHDYEQTQHDQYVERLLTQNTAQHKQSSGE